MKKAYVSDIDQFLKTYNKEHPEQSASQQKEIAEYERINQLRDHVKPKSEQTVTERIWKNF